MYTWDELQQFLLDLEIHQTQIDEISARFGKMKGMGTVITDADLDFVLGKNADLIAEFLAFCHIE